MKLRLALVALVVAISLIAPLAHTGELATKKALTLDVAKEMVAAAEAYAVEKNWNVIIAIVDDGANLLILHRMDGAQIGSIDVAIQKATTAVAYKRPSQNFNEGIAGGTTAILGLPHVLPFGGGIPISAGDQIIGGIGVSGVTSDQDTEIAEAAMGHLAEMLAK